MKPSERTKFKRTNKRTVRWFVCLFVRLFVCSFVRLFVCSFVRLFVCSFVRSFGVVVCALLAGAVVGRLHTSHMNMYSRGVRWPWPWWLFVASNGQQRSRKRHFHPFIHVRTLSDTQGVFELEHPHTYVVLTATTMYTHSETD